MSIRPGWFYHAAEDAKVKSADELTRIYFESVGRGANLILNLPPDRRGQIPDADAANLRQWKATLDQTFAANLADTATVTADAARGPAFAAENVRSTDLSRYYAATDAYRTPTVTLAWPAPVTFDVVRLGEAVALGQRVDRLAVDVQDGTGWRMVARVEGVGPLRLVRLPAPVTTAGVRVRVEAATATPCLCRLGVYKAPTAARR